jgi:hypothetical protein
VRRIRAIGSDREIEFIGEPLITPYDRLAPRQDGAVAPGEAVYRHKEFQAYPIKALSSVMDGDNPLIVAVNGDGDVALWNPNTYEPPEILHSDLPDIVCLCTFRHSAKLLAGCGTTAGRMLLVELATGKVVGGSREPRLMPRATIQGLTYADLREFGIELGDFSVLLGARADASIEVWDLNGSEVCLPWSGHTAAVQSIAVTEQNGWPVAVSAGSDSTIRFWDFSEFAAPRETRTAREQFAAKLEDLRLADLAKNQRSTSDLTSRLGVSSSTFWAWIHGKTLPSNIDLVHKLEDILLAGPFQRFYRGELVYLYERAVRERAVAAHLARQVASEPTQVGKAKDYDLFVSYSHSDRSIVRQFAELLRGRGVRVWYDQWEMRPGDVLRERISDGIARASNFVVLLSKSSLKSNWVKYELNSGMLEEIERGKVKVIPALGPGVKPEEMPIDLRAKLSIDLRTELGRGKAVDALVDLSQPQARLRRELIQRLKTAAGAMDEVDERRRYSRHSDSAVRSAAMRGLAATSGHGSLLALAEWVSGLSISLPARVGSSYAYAGRALPGVVR